MKISYMLKREDFYAINKNTLKKYYQNSKHEKRLYIYPELNAIVTARPSKVVRRYLYTEFRVNGSYLKRLLVRLYAGVLLNSGGLLATKSLKIKTDADADTLIYPCNKKYRVFDFKANKVSVLGKDGFPTDNLMREMQFRTNHSATFIPGFLYCDNDGYTEMIIDGCPVARTGTRMPELCDRAFAIWSDYIRPYTRQIPMEDYAAMLEARIEQLKVQLQNSGKHMDTQRMDGVCRALLQQMRCGQNSVPISLSHGDLQPGNIWVENGTDKLYIIDWESWQERSTWYDRATLYDALRRSEGIAEYAICRDPEHATVLLEDVIFRLVELTTLPGDYGRDDFDSYLQMLQGGNADV